MSDIPEWQPGDLALCVNDRDNPRYHMGRVKQPLRSGRIYTVTGLHVAEAGYRDAGTLGLFLEGFPHCAKASRFRKVTPPKADEFDRETIALMNSKPVRVGETA